jgi:hypothetical protein
LERRAPSWLVGVGTDRAETVLGVPLKEAIGTARFCALTSIVNYLCYAFIYFASSRACGPVSLRERM